MFNPKDFLTVNQAAEQLGYFPGYVAKLIRDGKLKAIKRGRQYFISPLEIDKYVGLSEVEPDKLS